MNRVSETRHSKSFLSEWEGNHACIYIHPKLKNSLSRQESGLRWQERWASHQPLHFSLTSECYSEVSDRILYLIQAERNSKAQFTLATPAGGLVLEFDDVFWDSSYVVADHAFWVVCTTPFPEFFVIFGLCCSARSHSREHGRLVK